ncbi:unnamed protein product [Ambrosiozyma monospora]|uniref:Unnamed protein product n=1 Tax=Ambrosiozyma monospora TaxID=43982 RepID=A0ACB5SSY1_AMBMO|nr:unnamed protein product [Ambrosiozyma monospora]
MLNCATSLDMHSHMVSQEGQNLSNISETTPIRTSITTKPPPPPPPPTQIESFTAAASSEQSLQQLNPPDQESLKEPAIHHQQEIIQKVNSIDGQSRPHIETSNTQRVILDQVEMIPPELMKYWNSRYQLFKKFDDGIQLMHELWYSVTPELLAVKLAKFIKRNYPKAHNIGDLFCGGGGNTIQFLKVFDRVIGIDNNKVHLECTRNNSLVYLSEKKVSQKLTLLHSCWGKKSNKKLTDMKTKIDIMFGSPPWGGISSSKSKVFDVNLLKPSPLNQLLMSMKQFSDVIVLFLSRNSSIKQIEKVTAEVFGGKAKVKILEARIGPSLKSLFCCWGRKFSKHDW